jgi:phage shock protein A
VAGKGDRPYTALYHDSEDGTATMGKLFRALRAQLNKIANLFFEADPIAVMQLEVDQATERLKEGRKGLEIYRGLVETVARQVAKEKTNAAQLESQIKAHLKAGNREVAGQFAIQLQKVQNDLASNEQQLQTHEQAYQNNLLKIQKANKDIVKVREKIRQYDAELKMSAAEAEIAQISESFDMNVTTDFGQIEAVIQKQIDTNRGRARVAADMSSKGIEAIKAEEAAEKALAEDLLSKYEVQLGLKSPETTVVAESVKNLGPTVDRTTT